MSKGRITALLAVILAAAIILKPPQEKTVYVIQNETGCVQYTEDEMPLETENENDSGTAAVIAIIIIVILIVLFGGSEQESS